MMGFKYAEIENIVCGTQELIQSCLDNADEMALSKKMICDLISIHNELDDTLLTIAERPFKWTRSDDFKKINSIVWRVHAVFHDNL